MLCDKLEGRMRWEVRGRLKREETHVYLRLTHADVRQRPKQRSEAIFLQFKINVWGKKYAILIFLR